MNKFFGAVVSVGMAAIAHAQAPTGLYVWQVSNDNGATWSSNCNTAGIQIAKVRLLAYWAGIPDAIGVGYAGGQFDVTLRGDGPIGAVDNIVRPSPFNFAPQTLVTSSFAWGKKIDTQADVSEPGIGTGWVNPGQAGGFWGPPGQFNGTNGAVIFTFDVHLAYDFTRIGMVLNPNGSRAMAIYSNSTGTQVRIDATRTTVVEAFLNLPTPASLAPLALGALITARRRRSSSPDARTLK